MLTASGPAAERAAPATEEPGKGMEKVGMWV